MRSFLVVPDEAKRGDILFVNAPNLASLSLFLCRPPLRGRQIKAIEQQDDLEESGVDVVVNECGRVLRRNSFD